MQEGSDPSAQQMESSQSATSQLSPAPKPKRVKRPNEDAWLKTLDDSYFDRNFLDSRRRAILNPDLLKPMNLHCFCGNDIHLRDSWYVMVNDGTLVCNNCAQCHCCSREAKPISRRLVCVDGLVLCYQCIKFFGHLHRPKLRLRVQHISMKNPLLVRKPAKGSALATVTTDEALSPSNVSNSEYYDYNVPREDRCKFVPKEDMRRLFRQRQYDTPVRALPRTDNWRVVPPDYLADNSHQPPANCPACNSIALGPIAYVVPSMSRVYHRRCFRCCNCKESLAHGYKLAGHSFEYCSCVVPLVWCTKAACRSARFMHHSMAKCHLGCLRPGGRFQMDYTVEISAEKSRRRKRAGKNRKDPNHLQQQQQPQLQQQQQQQSSSVEDDESTVRSAKL